MRKLGSLFSEFYKKNLEFAQYINTDDKYPSLTIKKNYYTMRPWNPFAIRVTFTDANDKDFDFSFLVYRTGKDDNFFWTRLSPRGIFIDPVGGFNTWEEALNGLELYCMEYFDTNEPMWDSLAEL